MLRKFSEADNAQEYSIVLVGLKKSGLIYTENKPLGRLCKMCNPFFYEFRVVPSVNVFKLYSEKFLGVTSRVKQFQVTKS